VTDNINIQQTVNQVTVSSVGVQGPVGPVGSSASSVSFLVSANQGTTVSSSTSYMNFTGGITATATGGSVTINVPVGGTTSNATSLNGISGSAYALLASSNFTGASVGGLSVATQNYVTNQGFITSSGSVTYATNSGSSTYSSSAGAAPIPASVSYAASAGAAPIPASVSYSASAGTANNSINLGGQASTYYYPASSINAASVAYAINSGSSLYSSSAGAAPIPASVSYSASSGTANNSNNFAGQAQSYYAPISSPNFTGTPLAPTAPSATNTTQIATTAFVRGEITNLVNSAPTTLDTLSELAAALGNDPNFATTTASLIGLKAPINNPSFTGTVNLGSSVATGSVSSALNSASLAGQPGSYYYPASSITAASVVYATNAGNSLTTSQTNFSTLTISSSNVATQAYVNNQGYLISSGSISTASNSASLGGQPASYYYPSVSITTASVAYATNAGNSTSTSQTNFSSLTISGSGVATQNYVNNKFFYETIPFSVTGSVSTAGPWDYRFYNDTGGTRSINGVRASVGTAPSGSAMIIDVRKNGITGENSIFTASGISISSGSTTSGLISSGFNSGSSVASGDYLTVAVTQVGSTTAGSDLVVQVMWS
jgi:hypothetical protein